MLRVAVTGPSEREVAGVGAVWCAREGDAGDVVVAVVPWPVHGSVVVDHQLVVGVSSVAPPASGGVDAWTDPDAAAAVWSERVVPFAANLAARRRAPRARVARLVGPDPTWPDQAARLIARVRHALGDHVLHVDHIGSTSVPGLPAKDVVDVQVTVPDLAVAADAAASAPIAGLVDVGEWDAPDRTGVRFSERVLVDADPGRPATVNLRPVGDPVWREVLLFRDWLRADPSHRDAYLVEKRRLASATAHVDDYGGGKLGWIGAALGRAGDWASTAGWEP